MPLQAKETLKAKPKNEKKKEEKQPLAKKQTFDSLLRNREIKKKLSAAVLFWALRPWESLSSVSAKTGLPRTLLVRFFKEKLGIYSLRPFKAIRMKKRAKIKIWRRAQEDYLKINPKLRDFFIPTTAYFNNNFFGDLVDHFPSPNLVVRLTREGNMETSLKKLILFNLRKALHNEYEHINQIKRGKRTVTKEQEEEIEKIVKAAEKRLDAIGLDARLCPAYTPSDKDARGKNRMLAEKGHYFSPAVLAIPYFNANPPKRLQIASHLIAKKHSFKLLHPEEPLVQPHIVNGLSKPHNFIEGVNLKVRFPRTKEENDLTKEGAIIITKKAAEKLRYRLQTKPKTILVKDPKDLLPEGTFVLRGDLIIKDKAVKHNLLFRQFLEAPVSGFIRYVEKPKKRHRKEIGDFYQLKYIIEREALPMPGDKIISPTGLKGVIGKIIDDDKYGADIIIHPTEVWREDEKQRDGTIKDNYQKRRGAMVLEMLNSGGHLYVTYDENGFVLDNISDKFKFSPTVLSGIFARGGTLEDIEKYIPKGYLRDVFEALHLAIVKMPDGSYRVAQDLESPKGKYTIKLDPPEDFYGVKYDKIKVPPTLLPVGINSKGDIYLKALTPENIDKISMATRSRIIKMMRTAALYQIYNNALRPIYGKRPDEKGARRAFYTKIVARSIKPTEIALSKTLMDALGVKEGDYVTVAKEPVTTKWGVETLKVVRDDSVQLAAGISPYAAATLFNADFDGDTIFIMRPALDPEKFAPTQKTLLQEMESARKKDLKLLPLVKNPEEWLRSLKVEFVPEPELAKRAKAYNEAIFKHDNRLIKKRGGKKLDYVFAFPDIAEKTGIDPNLANKALDIEKAMKHKPLTAEQLREMEEKYGKRVVAKTIQEIEKAEEEDRRLEQEVAAAINKYVRREISPDKSRQFLRLLYKEQVKYPSPADLIGLKLEPDKFWIHYFFVAAFGKPYEYNEKTKDRFKFFTKRKEAYAVSYGIHSLEKLLQRTLKQVRMAERKKDLKMAQYHRRRAREMKDELVKRIKEAIAIYTSSEIQHDPHVQKELPQLKEKLKKYSEMKI